MRFITCVVHEVRDIKETRGLLVEGLDFHVESESDRHAVVNNGAISIRLISGGNIDESRLHLSMETNELEESCRYLSGLDFEIASEETWVSEYRKELSLQGPHGIHITLARNYNEDELGIVPDLPTSLEWSEDALSITKKLIALVPLSFRDNARRKVTQRAEADAIVEGITTVNLDLAMKAMVISTPPFRLEMLKSSMGDVGVDPLPYFPELDGPDA